jgi:hypothetical protein
VITVQRDSFNTVELLVEHENLDSCRCWRCTFYPCKVRNRFLVNFWNRTILLWIPV